MVQRGRHVLVVGATGRLGAAIAHGLAARGDFPILTARDGAQLDSLAADVARASGGSAPPTIAADLTQGDAVERIAEGGRAKTPGLSDIVLACGPFPRTPLEALRREDLERTLTVHAVVPLLPVHALSKDLARAQGSVVALADAGITRPFMNHVAYLTAKG